MATIPYQCLPLWAMISIERLDTDSTLRTDGMLDELLNGYRHLNRKAWLGQKIHPAIAKQVPSFMKCRNLRVRTPQTVTNLRRLPVAM